MPEAEQCFPFIKNLGLKTLFICVGAAGCGDHLELVKFLSQTYKTLYPAGYLFSSPKFSCDHHVERKYSNSSCVPILGNN